MWDGLRRELLNLTAVGGLCNKRSMDLTS